MRNACPLQIYFSQRKIENSLIITKFSMRLSSLIPVSLLAGLAAAQLIGPVGPTTNLEDKNIECNILDYGGVADNQTDVAASIEATFTECVLNNPKRRLVVPKAIT